MPKIGLLIDNSGGFWVKALEQKMGFTGVIRQNIVPPKRVMGLFGREMISSVKGGVKHKIVATFANGKAHYKFVPIGEYPFGIKKRISPDGQPYEELEGITLDHRKWKAKEGYIPRARGEHFILRETSNNIFNAMFVKNKTVAKIGHGEVEVGWRNEELALLHDKGGKSGPTIWFGNYRESDIPARPFIGLQKDFTDNVTNVLAQL